MSTEEKKKFTEPTIEIINSEDLVDMYAFGVELVKETVAEGGY